MSTTPPPTTTTSSGPGITLRLPYKYSRDSSHSSQSPPQTIPFPPLSFLHRTWSVTHSTLSMWRSARNVRITYRPLSPTKDGVPRVDDLVEYESLSGSGSLKSVSGVDTGNWSLANIKDDTTCWDWRGSGWLFFVSSHWEILGWGEIKDWETGEVKERWVVTWFAPTVFTKEGVDVYSDLREGGSKEMVEGVLEVLKRVVEEGGEGTKGLREMVEGDMREVKIELPWKERS
ncbi:hypothetical protein SMACR_08259 [Sordaria macrospora]|uniref:WGS project CABT00000000 data, contig 2.56 n=2 Tax=Sordaria macrospora TaxID=5147 RepID=F7W9Y3_SORMK|nr:uncharacterized protein SMAC_08259 [Sordaria macrospora k-hell]KAA8631243.1 hypothetical protein SMACR_08259 [Sordaria macrospora]WPJ64327.1 hypothetical protein SMAC4_08259 [Sordaria macrospora]CCC05250.1 unnamed protein product [Sordaria macrospora k-hell]